MIGQNNYSALKAKARERGEVKVIVQLNLPVKQLSAISKAEADAEMDAISKAQGRVLQRLINHKVKHAHSYRYTPYMVMTVDDAAFDALFTSPNVLSAEEDIAVPPTLDLTMPRIGASATHNAGYDGAGVAVAILDTGVDKNHPFLAGSVISEACYSSNGTNVLSLCPGGVTSSTSPNSAMPYGAACPAYDCDHGTHVAGIAAGGAGVNGSPGPGVAPGASIIAIQVFSRFNNDADCGGAGAARGPEEPLMPAPPAAMPATCVPCSQS